MKKIHYILGLLTIATGTLFVSCGVDNYDLPDATLTGTVTDIITGKPLITEQPDGFRVRNEEISWSDNPLQEHFWGKADGTYRNTKMFPGKYRITLVEGPFVQPEPVIVDLKSNQTVTQNFTVTPYVSFSDVSIEKYVPAGDSVKVTFKLSRNAGTIKDYRIFATDQTPLVGMTYFDSKFSDPHYWTSTYEEKKNPDGTGTGIFEWVDRDNSKAIWTLTNADLGTTITATLKGYVPGHKYWIRIGACCNESNGRYNLTEVKELAF
jgi:hypothetical protein